MLLPTSKRLVTQDGVQDVFCPDEEYNQNRANVRNIVRMIEDDLNFSRYEILNT